MAQNATVLQADLVPAVVHQVIRLVAPQAPQHLRSDHQLIGDLGFHSLSLAELGFTLEDLFRLDSITPERAMALRTVEDIVDLILNALAQDAAELPATSEVETVCAQYGTTWNPAA
ncbi:acyl carrier protein [Streptomyces sp. NBC_01387]|uniref:acyl carrier protein n=1 Tax=unclassified Streptomyces TaxID=2593676 RepID=UPI002E0D847D|nr:acyl carrier protein [Streptomyces sp. NBC_01197]WSS47264.1 acyl carrier protein [Streptomyces sp. NBC_01180]